MPKFFKKKSDIQLYREGGKGFSLWCETNVRIPVYHKGSYIPQWTLMSSLPTNVDHIGRSYSTFWEQQKLVADAALEMKDGQFLHRLIAFCWPRGEGKSFLAVLVQLWKFFNFPRQQIMLGANSKEQTKFVHYSIMCDIILNSPKLLKIIGKRNIQEKEIRLRDSRGNVGSFIRSISTSTGIVSNITGYTFSEIFDMKNPKFFTQLDGSIRNIPNALGVIDSTVSDKNHILYKLFDTYTKNKDPFLFFSHRFSHKAEEKDYWSPGMTKEQLNSYKNKFPPQAFAQYFKNTWESANKSFFDEKLIGASHYLGKDGALGQQQGIIDVLTKTSPNNEEKTKNPGFCANNTKIRYDLREKMLLKSLIPINSVYSLTTASSHSRMCDLEELQALCELYQSDAAILIGLDRADPLKVDVTMGARTIITVIAKLLPNSKNNPDSYMEDGEVKEYMYFLLHLAHVENNDLTSIKYVVRSCLDEYGSIESFASERWGMFDILDFCEENDIGFESISPSYDIQKAAFSELWLLYKAGKFKAPTIAIFGSKKDDILEEELTLFDHNPEKRWYGSPEKSQNRGVQDDCVYALCWAVYGGRMLNANDFRSRKGNQGVFGEFHMSNDLVGKY